MTTYRVLTDLEYHGKRAEPGALVDDLPASSVRWLLRDGHIEEIEGLVNRGAGHRRKEDG